MNSENKSRELKKKTEREALRKAEMSFKDRAWNQLQDRAQKHIASDNMSSKDRAQNNKRKRDNWTNMSSENKSRDLKKKAKREALRKAGFTRQEHEKIMQQQKRCLLQKN